MKIKINEGDVFKVKLTDGRHTFGRVLPDTFAFYNYVMEQGDEINLELITSSEIICKLWVTEFSLKKGLWPIVGNLPLDMSLKDTVVFYKQDRINNKVWKTLNGGDKIPTTVEECMALEIAAVWDPEHVVARLDCFFEDKSDIGLQRDKERLITKGISTK